MSSRTGQTSSNYSISDDKSEKDSSKSSYNGIKQIFSKRTRRTSVHEKYRNRSDKSNAMEAGSRDKKFDIFFRLGLNCSEFFIVGLLLMVHIVFNASGLWYRQTTILSHPIQDEWATVANSCILTPSGFQSCSVQETSLVPTRAWHAIGAAIAEQAFNSTTVTSYSMTTCVVGLNKGYGSIVFLFSDYWTPFCAPSSAENISAMVLLETAYDETITNVRYMLSTYVDRINPVFETRVDSDNTQTTVLADVTKQLVTSSGEITRVEHNYTNWRYVSFPLLIQRYQFRHWCFSEFISTKSVDSFRGETSKCGLFLGKTCSHMIDNNKELSITQNLSIIVMCHLFGGDIFTTLKGLQGVLLRRPVLTYEYLSGLERRKITMVLLIFVRLGGLFYLEVARLYHRTYFQRSFFYIVCAMASGILTLLVFWVMVILQHLPSIPIFRERAIRIFAPFMHIGPLVLSFVIVGATDISEKYYEPLWKRPQTNLPIMMNGTSIATGVYDSLIVASCMDFLMPKLLIGMITMLVLGIIYPMIRHRQLFLDMRFFARNEFLSSQFVPSYFTCLPMYETECIKYGKKLFLKASTLALMGYGIIEEDYGSVIEVKPAGAKHETPPHVVISLYDLVASLLPLKLYLPQIICTIHNYQYQAVPPGTQLRRSTRYLMNKGTCVS